MCLLLSASPVSLESEHDSPDEWPTEPSMTMIGARSEGSVSFHGCIGQGQGGRTILISPARAHYAGSILCSCYWLSNSPSAYLCRPYSRCSPVPEPLSRRLWLWREGGERVVSQVLVSGSPRELSAPGSSVVEDAVPSISLLWELSR